MEDIRIIQSNSRYYIHDIYKEMMYMSFEPSMGFRGSVEYKIVNK